MITRLCDRIRKNLAISNIGSKTGTYFRRQISNSQLATALRPFYFAVHPDLFGRHPKQRSVNEESLKQLSGYFQGLLTQNLNLSKPKILNFYIRNSSDDRDSFKLINISLDRTSAPKLIVKNILEACNLSTKYVDSINSQTSNKYSGQYDVRYEDNSSSPFGDIKYGSEFSDFEAIFREKSEMSSKTLLSWLKENVEAARERNKELDGLKEEVSKLQASLIERLHLTDLRYECGWNFEHYRGCLKTLERLADMHGNQLKSLEGRIVIFAPFTGVSLEGHVMLFTGDVLNNWLDFIRHIQQHDSYLKKIPSYEYALSQVLRKIRIGRRKFMPKQQAMGYAGHLSKVTTNLLDFLTTKSYPDDWPSDLSFYEIVIESESGPLMVSPTGQLIAPATIPGFMLVDFLSTHFEEATEKANQYNTNKHIERSLHKRCLQELDLKSLTKDDSVTPDKMIETMNKLLSTTNASNLTEIHLNITNFYSLSSDGTVCIPWDFKV